MNVQPSMDLLFIMYTRRLEHVGELNQFCTKEQETKGISVLFTNIH